jgi:hypothetical protein
METTMWTKTPYGEPNSGHWTIGNEHLQFDVHIAVSGSGKGVIVSEEEADAYANHILRKLNERDSIDFRPRLR